VIGEAGKADDLHAGNREWLDIEDLQRFVSFN
jgi:hypothetical protein